MKIYEPNYTQVPNTIISLMPDLSEAELKVLLAIVRKTLGWQKVRDRISLSQLQKMTGMSRTPVSNATQNLEEMGAISVHRDAKGNEYELMIHESESASEENRGSTESVPQGDEVVQNIDQGSTESVPVGSTDSVHTKETITKETKQKKRSRPRETISRTLKNIPVPDWAKSLFDLPNFGEAYTDYWQYMKENYNRWPAEISVKTDYKKLRELQDDGHDPVKVIHQTIHAKAKSFFAIRDFDNKKPKDDDWDQAHLKSPAYKGLGA